MRSFFIARNCYPTHYFLHDFSFNNANTNDFFYRIRVQVSLPEDGLYPPYEGLYVRRMNEGWLLYPRLCCILKASLTAILHLLNLIIYGYK